MRVLHITPEAIPERKPVLDRIAEMERKLAEPKQRTILAPFRMPGGSTADGYYDALRVLVDEGKLTTTYRDQAPTYRLTEDGWAEAGNKPLWL